MSCDTQNRTLIQQKGWYCLTYLQMESSGWIRREQRT
ncbi:hypothetical protein M3J09_007852 [Ascochyta lentis]